MPSREQLEKLKQDLLSTTPLFAGMKRRKAVKALVTQAGDPEVIPLLVLASQMQDEGLATRATEILQNLSASVAIDALCVEAVREPSGPIAKICLDQGYRPRDERQACLYLFVTGQLDAYFEEDSGFQLLRLAYDHANAHVQAQVMEIVRSGDKRCLGFFGRQKALQE